MFSLENVVKTSTDSDFNRVPAIDECFGILDLMARSRRSFGINGTAKRLNLKKSTAYNIVHKLIDLQVLETGNCGRLGFGTRLNLLGKVATPGLSSSVLSVLFLREISET